MPLQCFRALARLVSCNRRASSRRRSPGLWTAGTCLRMKIRTVPPRSRDRRFRGSRPPASHRCTPRRACMSLTDSKTRNLRRRTDSLPVAGWKRRVQAANPRAYRISFGRDIGKASRSEPRHSRRQGIRLSKPARYRRRFPGRSARPRRRPNRQNLVLRRSRRPRDWVTVNHQAEIGDFY